MIIHHLKLAWRNLLRNKAFSGINIAGLCIGLAGCILIGLYTFHEFSVDRFHPNHKNIYRVNKSTNEKGGTPQTDGITPGKLASALEMDFPEVVAATRFRPWFNEMLVSHETTRLKLDEVIYADPSFLRIFNFPLLRGDKKTALTNPNCAIITETTAAKYFNKEDPVGKILVTLNNIPVKITGVAKDVPSNSSIQFTMLISWATIAAPANAEYFSWMDNWTTQVNFTFVQLKENANAKQTGDKINKLMHNYRKDDEFQYRAFLQPLDNIYLDSKDIIFAGYFRGNSKNIVITLLVIAAFILFIACFNFINLSTAGAISRAKETGVQKVLGARQSQLVGKFFSESFLLCFVSLAIAVLLVIILLPFFNKLANTNLDASFLQQSKSVGFLLLLLFLISIIAGLYPAIFLSRFRSTDVFRNIIKAGKSTWLRKTMVTTQFALSIFLIIATLVVNQQIRYVSSKDLGFEKDQVVVLQLTNTGVESKSNVLTASLLQSPDILSVSSTNRVPGQSFTGYGIIPEGHRLEEHLVTNVLETDAAFLSTYGIQLKEGRFFSPKMPTDTMDAIVINEALAKYVGWNDPLGKQLEIYEARKGKVIGVMKDFHFASLRETVQPLAIMLNNNPLYMSIKLKAGSTESGLNHIKKQWQSLGTEYPFDYFFMDEQLDRYYKADARLLRVLSGFAGMAIVIACMGLFGLGIYASRQRTKEIGIRKVLGASVANITGMLSKDFLKLVVIAAVIAFPLSWFAMHKWLQDFAYRVSIGWWVFLVAGILALIIAFLTISVHAIKAAMANPVNSLRSE